MITQLPSIFLPGQIKLTLGRASDYHALARFHYTPSPPATFAAVICAHWCGTNACESVETTPRMNADPENQRRRGASRGSSPTTPLAPTLSFDPSENRSAARAAAFTEPHSFTNGFPTPLIGVVVLSYPSALHRTRHRVFGLRSMRFGERLHWVNANLRTISRVVVHPQFRGVGLSTTLIRAAVDACPTALIEASARMGRAHPLFDRAGLTRVEPITPEEAIYFWLKRAPSPSSPAGVNDGRPPDSAAGCVPHNPDEKNPLPGMTPGRGRGVRP